jgi:ABC-type polysaccharide/polyol phosphate export permease
MQPSMQVYDSDVKQTPIISQVQAVWKKRGLLKLLVARDLTVRYKRSVIGIWWSLLNPLFTTAVMFWVFNTVFKARMPDGTAFLPYLLSGVLVMSLFNQGLTMAADAIASGAGVLTKIYVRPEIFAFSATISSAINFLFGLVPLTLVLAISHKWPGWQFPLVIVVIVCMTLFTTGLGLMLAIAYVNFDDMRSLIQIVLLALQYMTPVFYPLSVLGPHTKRVIELNPLTSYLSVFRDVFGNNYVASTSNWMMMIASSIVMFCVGFYVFQNKWASVVAKI